MAFKKQDRQRIIDEYLAETGRNMFLPGEFVDWLKNRPDHEAYEMFFGMSVEDAAREHRITLARRLASGLRIVVHQSPPQRSVIRNITTREYPAYVSPMSGRKSGGGYVPVDSDDEEHLAEIRRQGVLSLRSWLARYRGAFEQAGIDVSPIEEIIASQDASVAQSA